MGPDEVAWPLASQADDINTVNFASFDSGVAIDLHLRTKPLKARSASAGKHVPNKATLRGYTIVTNVIDEQGMVRLDLVADYFSMSKSQLAETVGVRPETLHREKRMMAAKTQSRVKEMLEIVSRVADWAGGADQAMTWYRAEPLPAFGGRTAEFLVKDGKATAVRDYLDDIALGGFA